MLQETKEMEEMLPCTFTPRINPKILKSPPKVKVE
jgi:hypothetical protein